MKAQIDHLVIVAHNLEQGVQWCEATLGITPSPGGEHKLFGTHNRLFKIATPTNPMAYCEIIAINPNATPTIKLGTKRWFDMDDAALQAAVAVEPRLMHFVANTPDVQAACAARQRGRRHPRHGARPTGHSQLLDVGVRIWEGYLARS